MSCAIKRVYDTLPLDKEFCYGRLEECKKTEKSPELKAKALVIAEVERKIPGFLRAPKKGERMKPILKLPRSSSIGHEDKIFQFQGEPIVVPTIKHYPPDTTAAIFWLKNRQPHLWRDKQEVEVNAEVNHHEFNDETIKAAYDKLYRPDFSRDSTVN